MNSRDLSERLDELANMLEAERYQRSEVVQQVIDELRKLSNEKYVPGNGVSWADIKPKTVNKTFTDKSGKKLPF